MKKTGTRGFTLIELLVVIAIIGILSSVVLASLNSARQKSRDAKRVSDVKQLQLALELYFDSLGQYPATLAPLAPTYIATIPLPPAGAGETAYKYAGLNTSCTSYHLGATLEDKGHTVFASDVDAAANAAAATACNAAGVDFSGLDDPANGIFDVKP